MAFRYPARYCLTINASAARIPAALPVQQTGSCRDRLATTRRLTRYQRQNNSRIQNSRLAFAAERAVVFAAPVSPALQ
jgi:hypothetical protein